MRSLLETVSLSYISVSILWILGQVLSAAPRHIMLLPRWNHLFLFGILRLSSLLLSNFYSRPLLSVSVVRSRAVVESKSEPECLAVLQDWLRQDRLASWCEGGSAVMLKEESRRGALLVDVSMCWRCCGRMICRYNNL